ncbi:MAG: hypothetical protein KKG94_04505 [Nanoarchaeota archaeon]|nr:hypothetical protein [Nanoarchaeota archaeon]
MARKYITIGGILGIIGAFALLFWVIGFSSDLIKNPTDEKNIEKVVDKTIDEATPPQANIITKLAPYGVGGAILIILFILFWNKIMNYRIPLS